MSDRLRHAIAAVLLPVLAIAGWGLFITAVVLTARFLWELVI